MFKQQLPKVFSKIWDFIPYSDRICIHRSYIYFKSFYDKEKHDYSVYSVTMATFRVIQTQDIHTFKMIVQPIIFNDIVAMYNCNTEMLIFLIQMFIKTEFPTSSLYTHRYGIIKFISGIRNEPVLSRAVAELPYFTDNKYKNVSTHLMSALLNIYIPETPNICPIVLNILDIGIHIKTDADFNKIKHHVSDVSIFYYIHMVEHDMIESLAHSLDRYGKTKYIRDMCAGMVYNLLLLFEKPAEYYDELHLLIEANTFKVQTISYCVSYALYLEKYYLLEKIVKMFNPKSHFTRIYAECKHIKKSMLCYTKYLRDNNINVGG